MPKRKRNGDKRLCFSPRKSDKRPCQSLVSSKIGCETKCWRHGYHPRKGECHDEPPRQQENVEPDSPEQPVDESPNEGVQGEIKKVYSFIRKIGALAEHDDDSLQKNRAKPAPGKGVSTGWGEVGQKSLQTLIDFVQSDARTRIDDSSTIVDVGSGFGKVLIHFALATPAKKLFGVELVRKRNQIAEKAVAEFNLRSRIKLEVGNVTDWKKFSQTHIYMYDKVFHSDTTDLLIPILNKSDFSVFVSYKNPSFWGLNLEDGLNAECIHKLSMSTTGGSKHMCYVYVKSQ